MTDQEIIKALRCHLGDVDGCKSCPAWSIGDRCISFVNKAAADRLEELTASQHVMTMREDA